MRYLAIILAVLCCACASTVPKPRRNFTPEEIKENERDFYREFSLENYDEAMRIAKEKKVDRKMVEETVIVAMWRKIYDIADVPDAKNIMDKFQLDRAVQTVFAQSAIDYLLRSKQCNIAADVAFYFDLGQTYADKAILCSDSMFSISHTTQLACDRPGTPQLGDKIKAKWLVSFEEASPSTRDYWPISEIAEACSFTEDQYLLMYNVCLSDNQMYLAFVAASTLSEKKLMSDDRSQLLYRRVFQASITVPGRENLAAAKMLLEDKKFIREAGDYDNFFASAIAQFQCGMAATVAIEHNLPDASLEAIFMNRRCLGGTLSEIDPHIIHLVKRPWVFELSLRAREYLFARNMVSVFEMDDSYFEQIVDAAIDAKDFLPILGLEPPDDWGKTIYQWWILGRLMDLDEEWFVTIYTVAWDGTFSIVDINWYLWVEQAYLHALRRGAFALAADIAAKHRDADFMEWGVKLAFDHACDADNLPEAGDVARRYHLGKAALKRVALLVNKKNIAAEKNKKKRECQKDWNAEPCE